MNISKAEYEDLKEAEADADRLNREVANANRRTVILARALADVADVAQGREPGSSRRSTRGSDFCTPMSRSTYDYGYTLPCGHVEPPTTEQVQRQEIAALRESLAHLQGTLAATVATAQFAIEHLS